MVALARRRRTSQFQRAADGSMSLMEHLRELRSRLFKAALGVVVGLAVGYFFAQQTLEFLIRPYCELRPPAAGQKCQFITTGPLDVFLLDLRIALYLGLMLSAPVWLYQLWAFIAPGLHRHERRYTYLFVAVATPLFTAGATLAYFIVAKSLHFFLGNTGTFDVTVGLPGYFDFVTSMMLLFGAGFEFPLVVVMLNFVGIVSARRLLGWWRIAIFLMFVFGAVVTPTPDPFGMSALAGALALLYFAAVGVAFLNDRRRERRHEAEFGGLDDDQTSPLTYQVDPVEPAESIDPDGPVGGVSSIEPARPVPAPLPLSSRYDDST